MKRPLGCNTAYSEKRRVQCNQPAIPSRFVVSLVAITLNRLLVNKVITSTSHGETLLDALDRLPRGSIDPGRHSVIHKMHHHL